MTEAKAEANKEKRKKEKAKVGTFKSLFKNDFRK